MNLTFNETAYLDTISGRRRGLSATVFRAGMSCLTPLYRSAIDLRNFLYDEKWIPTHRAALPVISVGNLTTGGTGKTPFVAWLVQQLKSHGRRPAIVSRGYRTSSESTHAGNDEQQLLEQLVPGTPHRQQRDRIASVQQLAATNEADIVVLDDGFQHRRLQRDLDLVLIDATVPWGYDHLLPRGLLREPHSSLHRADLVIVTRVDQVTVAERQRLQREIRRQTRAPIVETSFRATRWINPLGETLALEQLPTTSSLAFCGIGNPDGFRRSLRNLGQNSAADHLLVFPDHCQYLPKDRERIAQAIQDYRPEHLLTTRKDLVKFANDTTPSGLPLWAVDLNLHFDNGLDELNRQLRRFVGSRKF